MTVRRKGVDLSMWPKRKILLVIPRGIEGWQGILSLLEALHRDVIVRETSEEIPADLNGLTCPGLDEELVDLSDVGPTDILYWPGIPMEDTYRTWGLSQGLSQTELPEFLHRYWEDEIILPVTQSVLADEEPLLWKLLDAVNFEPSLLWKTHEGRWKVRIGQGLHWIIPKGWCKELGGIETFGRQPQRILSESYWLRQENRVDFYSDRESFAFLGSLEPYLDKEREQEIYATVLQALQLGVPWRNILSFYNSVLNSSRNTPLNNPRDDFIKWENSLRWNTDDIARGTWPSRTEFPTEGAEHLENRGIS